jgi:hypothetical protein
MAPPFKSSHKQSSLLASRAQKKTAPKCYLIFVRGRGLEPPRIAPLVPKTNAYTNFATRAYGCAGEFSILHYFFH